jgi:hypothetical protein
MAVFKVYIKPFDDFGVYQNWIDVTANVDLNAISGLKQNLDNTQYDIGIYRNSSFNLKLDNRLGLFSDIGAPRTIFRYKRANSLVKVTWEMDPQSAITGIAVAEQCFTSEETTIFTGLLSDENLTQDLAGDNVTFTVLGRESIFDSVAVPFSSLANGQMISAALYALLNQSAITTLLTVSPSTIACGVDVAIDDVSSLATKTVKEALADLLLISNSVLYISGDTLIITPRTAGATVKAKFYGAGSTAGIENVQTLSNIRNGFGRIFNFLTWSNTSLLQSDPDSLAKYGVRKKDFSSALITDNTKRNTILASVLSEFAFPKREMELTAPVTFAAIALGLLDRISVDYPIVYFSEENPLPICGVAICGAAVLPKGLWSYSVDPADGWKIMGREITPKTNLMKLTLRAA